MKLLRYGPTGQEKPGILDRSGQIRDLSGVVRDIDGAALAPASLTRLRGIDPATLPLVSGTPRLGPCVGNVPKIVAIGLNYRLHAQEAGMPIPTEPIFFMKATSSICGPNDDVIIPKGSQKTDYEVELGIVIGTRALCRHQGRQEPHRRLLRRQRRLRARIPDGARRAMDQGQELRHVLPDRPWLVTADEAGDAGKLQVSTEVNGERRQNSNTADLIFGIEHIVSYVSQFMTLLPGDVIPTGTPSGVAMGFKPPRFLKAGDRMRVAVEGLGEQNSLLVAYRG